MQISLKIPSIVSVAGCLGYDVLENGTSSGKKSNGFQLLVV